MALFLLVFALLAGAAAPGLAATTPAAVATPAGDSTGTSGGAPGGLTSAEAQQLLAVLQNPQKRQQLITTLQSLQKLMPVVAPAASKTPTPTTTTTTTTAKAKPAVALKPNSLGADILTGTGTLMTQVDDSLAATLTSVTDYQEFVGWASSLSRNPTIFTTVLDAIWRLILVLAIAFAFEFVGWRLTRRLYDRLGRRSRTVEAEAVEAEAEAAEANRLPAEASTELPDSVATARTAVEAASSPPARGAPGTGGRAALQRLKPLQSGWLLVKRLPFILVAMALDAVPPIVFLGIATVLLATPLAHDLQTRLMIAAVVNAYVVVRLALVIVRGAFCAPSSKLRLLHVSDAAAAFLTVWCRRIAMAIVLAFIVVQIGGMSGMSYEMQHGVGRVFGLIIHLMLVIMVLQRRREVEDWLRGQPGESRSVWHELKARLASVWHIQAIILIVMVWIVYATAIANGIGHPFHLILKTMGLLVLYRVVSILVLGGLDKAFSVGTNTQTGTRYALITARAMRYHAPLRTLVKIGMGVLFFLVLFQSWGVDAWNWFEVGGLGGRLISSLGTIMVTLVIAVIVWETINFVMQIYMDDLSQQGAYVRAARLRTVVPVLRNTLLIALLVVIALTALSEIGVNIAPLLAGASIIGVAIGFGSQKLVQDFITGIFLLLENAMQVGDWVTAAGLSGAVENLSIRTLRLRAGDGSIHIIPFSSVSTVTNTNRGLGNASVSVTISYEEDTDKVGEMLKQIALDMRREDTFKDGMLSDLQLWGVDKIDGTTATLAGQIVCTDGGRWGVQREFNRRVKLAFQEKGIRMMPSASIMGFQHPLDVRVEMPEMPTRPAERPTIEARPAEARPAEAPPDEAQPAEARPDAARPRRAGGSGP
ncbi:mechanosensitive ion channel family protein [Acidisoma sp.]|uniref:mechanosensitive ion channel family protein n=1 Tax=Acidisoma sp. TaxID=1872115 RepID=UPI003B0089CC